jgi:hypothetical protein
MSDPVTTFESDDKGRFFIRQTQDDIPVVSANFVEKMSRENGFSGKRLFRKVASIPAVAFTEAQRQGYNMDDPADVKAFLRKNPQYMTVSGFRTGRDTRIRVK